MNDINFRRFCWQYKHLCEKVSPESIGNILDLGCGDGELTVNFARVFLNACVTGVDKYSDYEDSAARRARAMKLSTEHGVSNRCTILEADAFHLPFSDERFDIIHARNFLHHIFDSRDRDSQKHIVEFFERMKKLLSGNGFFVISEIGPVNYLSYARYFVPRWLLFINQAHKMDYTSKFPHQTWINCLEKAGFDVVFLDHYVSYRLRLLEKVLANEFAGRFFHSSFTILAQLR